MTSLARAFQTIPFVSASARPPLAYFSRVSPGASHPTPAPTHAPQRQHPRSPFYPDPAQTDALISAIASDFNSSLAGLAEEYNTTLESLTLWMTRPDVAERLDALQSACAARVRLVAANFLPLAVETLRSVLADFRELHCNALCDTSSPRAMATRARAAENARRAASTLLRLAHFTPRGWRAAAGSTPSNPSVPPSGVAPLSRAVQSPPPAAEVSLSPLSASLPRAPIHHAEVPLRQRPHQNDAPTLQPSDDSPAKPVAEHETVRQSQVVRRPIAAGVHTPRDPPILP
ncbi:MAG: hypothetical protein IT433_09645 [Phycisphaerales bacterium]|nr:hypothetical protein [Phycisphaerales bacterium]